MVLQFLMLTQREICLFQVIPWAYTKLTQIKMVLTLLLCGSGTITNAFLNIDIFQSGIPYLLQKQ